MKIVITGGPCCGKSTIIDLLKDRGYITITETAREVIKDLGLDGNMTIDDSIMIQKPIFERQLEKERPLEGSEEIYFLDRGAIDCHGFYIHLRGDIPDDLPIYDIERYASILVLEPVGFVKDDVRREDAIEAKKIHERIVEAYANEGYDVIRIPLMSVEDRLEKILSIVEETGKKL